MKNLVPFVAILLLLSLNACDTYKASVYPQIHAAAPSPVIPEDDDAYGLAALDRKVIINGSLSIEVGEIDSTVDQLIELALAYDGYVVSSTDQKTIIRVTAGNFKPAIDEIKTMGDFVSQSLYGDDITDQYYDLELRLANAQKARTRYLELLQVSTTVDETLRIERELERLNGTIDLITGKLKKLNHLEEYATLTVTHTLKDAEKKPGLVSYVGIGVYKSVRWLFVRK